MSSSAQSGCSSRHVRRRRRQIVQTATLDQRRRRHQRDRAEDADGDRPDPPDGPRPCRPCRHRRERRARPRPLPADLVAAAALEILERERVRAARQANLARLGQRHVVAAVVDHLEAVDRQRRAIVGRGRERVGAGLGDHHVAGPHDAECVRGSARARRARRRRSRSRGRCGCGFRCPTPPAWCIAPARPGRRELSVRDRRRAS